MYVRHPWSSVKQNSWPQINTRSILDQHSINFDLLSINSQHSVDQLIKLYLIKNLLTLDQLHVNQLLSIECQPIGVDGVSTEIDQSGIEY